MKNIVSLFDKSGIAVLPWAEDGYKCFCFDIEESSSRVEHKNITYILGDIKDQIDRIKELDPIFISSFPPCTHLAVSGARWFKRKSLENPKFQEEAMSLVFLAKEVAEDIGCTYYIENPIGVVSTKWRKPDYKFHPWHFTGWCKDNNYTKNTCLWTSKDFIMPEMYKDPSITEEPDKKYIQHLGGRNSKTRAITPMGFAKAVHDANKHTRK